MSYILLIIGFIILIKSADFFVNGASSIAKALRIPTIIIGLTIVAFGTSAPEAAVSVTAALKGNNDIAIANVVGSNIFNLLAVIGIASMIKPVKVQKTTILKEFPFILLSSLVLLILSHDTKFQGYSNNELTKSDGLMLLALFSIFMYYLLEMAITSKEDMQVEQGSKKESIPKSLMISLLGIIGIIFGGQVVVDSASNIALSIGMSENLVGLTIVSIGTSLPELVTSVVAAKKGESDIAMGNVVGSNIFNILFVLGISAFINPISVHPIVFVDMFIMFIISIIAYIFATTKREVNKFEGLLMVLIYISYMVFIIIRQ
ncbi:CaCA family Na /Ca antiporter [[Clostridium] sordellii]|uniref:calcium/sodium antiporter n=1 Tax=Paraclostridium sordellii TaxID=1505 RepID=UPI0005E8E141|nr:calcium/sodium antiporter [Paeniclostridium sordellii]MDU2146413.1 calcium/sodium antiporter [Paeniclostridium sordellii]CEN80841.1 CaCA family Na /Ca antiporter [[Clostridium] sordellii] [Paeniclostridium sordellii]CEO26873.1 CaCA family Na /Ca antiporter [[Clostridium] sordellii] [Paeniclostridium sordellii]CEP41324.1 CaCA family Na /Ca antiporter [[Clostridium] sordellii] [Paeniclostridium sordellii]CEP43198.1 CaCA family Na /Ca antiporter [[Clostridium] sordellii] [Paeniclostridium sord